MSEESGLQRMRLAQLMELEQALLDLRDELAELPDELSEKLVPVSEIGRAVDRALEAQRQTLEIMVNELGAESRQAMQRITDSASKIERAAESIPKSLMEAQQQAERLRLEMADMSRQWRQRWWKTAIVAVVAGAIGAAMVNVGMLGLERLAPLGDVQKKAEAWQALVDRVTPQEAQWIQQILQRPAP